VIPPGCDPRDYCGKCKRRVQRGVQKDGQAHHKACWRHVAQKREDAKLAKFKEST
jgi:hypothetical protein